MYELPGFLCVLYRNSTINFLSLQLYYNSMPPKRRVNKGNPDSDMYTAIDTQSEFATWAKSIQKQSGGRRRNNNVDSAEYTDINVDSEFAAMAGSMQSGGKRHGAKKKSAKKAKKKSTKKKAKKKSTKKKAKPRGRSRSRSRSRSQSRAKGKKKATKKKATKKKATKTKTKARGRSRSRGRRMSRDMNPIMLASIDAKNKIGTVLGNKGPVAAVVAKVYRNKALGSMNYDDLDAAAKIKSYKDAVVLFNKDSDANHAKHLADAKAKMKNAPRKSKKKKVAA